MRVARPLENRRLAERVILVEPLFAGVAALHRLTDEEIPDDMLADEIERQERVSQMVKDPEEQHEVEALAECADVIDRELREFDIEAAHLSREARLPEIALVVIDREHARRAAPLHFQRIEPGIAADIEDGLAGEVGRDRIREMPPLYRRIVTEKIVRGGFHPVQVEIVEPRAERRHPLADLVGGE